MDFVVGYTFDLWVGRPNPIPSYSFEKKIVGKKRQRP
jgi:hypothetical protein